MRKSIVLGAGLMAATVALTGCGSNGGTTTTTGSSSSSCAADAGAISVWVDSNRQPAVQSIADEFKCDTGVTVNLEIKENTVIVDDFIKQANTDSAPDVVLAAHDKIGTMIQNGVIDPVELGDAANDLVDVAVKAFTYEGKTYGMPYSTESLALIRNTDKVAEAPATWDDMVAAAKAAGATQPIVIGMDSAQSASPYNLYPFQTSFGAPVFKLGEDGSYDPSALAMGGEAGANFAKWLDAQTKAGVLNISISNDIAKEQFTSGAAPFIITGPWNTSDFKTAGVNYAIDPIPSAGGETASPFVGVQGFVMNSFSDNKVAAQRFLVEYLGSEKVQTALFEAANRPPANKAALEAAQSDADVKAWSEVAATGVPMPNIPAMNGVWTDWGAAEAAIISGQSTDPAATWQSMVDKINSEI